MRRRVPWEIVALVILIIYPFVPVLDFAIESTLGFSPRLDRQLVNIFIFALLALGLNLEVGYAGLLQLGISAFFAIGAFTTGILTVEKYPFQIGFWGALLAAPAAAGLAGLALGVPTLRLRGDYLAIVTLGFGEVVRVVLLNLESVTDGPRGLNPVPAPWWPAWLGGGSAGGAAHLRLMYYLSLAALCGVVVFFRTLDRSRFGRALVALREDELAASSMGRNAAHIKLTAFTVGAAIAGLAGVFYATNLTTTAEPSTYDFNYSVMVLCCLIIGGLGSLRGGLLGAALLLGFDNIVSPLIAQLAQRGASAGTGNVFLSSASCRWFIFGLVLVLMMRFRPEGLWPSSRVKAELHAAEESPA